MDEVICPVCPHHCRLREGAYGRCKARKNQDGRVVDVNYGRLTALALDPIEKKPLAFFHPGSRILSVGSFGCNMNCSFCQNYEIAAAGEKDHLRICEVSPRELCELAAKKWDKGNIGVAYTYNEALTGYEYVRDTARLVHEAGMVNVLVTNGMVELPILEEVLPYIDAMNIDLKCFRPELYRRLGGELETVKAFIERAAAHCHVELTSLIVPGMNDDPEDMRKEAAWIAGISPHIPLHITRYFPRYKLQEPPTELALLRQLLEIATQFLTRVRLGNV